MNQNGNKAVVVGLDGVPFSLLQDLIRRDLTPNMKSIFSEGYFGQMSVTIPEISSISWSSFMTGTQSGEHNIFGFMDLEPGTYNLFFPNYHHLMAPTLWDDLALKGKKSIVINMPATYPAKEINGVLISGFVADRIGWQMTLALSCFGMIFSLLWLLFIQGIWMLYCFVAFYGISHGLRVPANVGILGEFFGMHSLGELIGIVSAISMAIGAFAPYFVGFVFDITGTYSGAFFIVMALLLCSGIVASLMKKPVVSG